MKILVLGNSDTRGAVVPGPTWPQQARTLLADDIADLELIDKKFVPYGPAAGTYLDGLLAELAPAIVVVPLGDYAFCAASVGEQLKHVFGKRVGRWYRRIELRFEKPPIGDVPTQRRWPYRVARTVGRRVIGTRTPVSVEEAASAYTESLRRMARVEDLMVIVVVYPASPALELPDAAPRRARFQATMRAVADLHHFAWLDGDAAIGAVGLKPIDACYRDGVHLSQAGHDAFAPALAAIVRAGLPTVAAPSARTNAFSETAAVTASRVR